MGIWGINIPVAWGFAITNYVWWIGIGMAGTFISAALLLLRQSWRTSINRAAESMTVMAVAIAGLFPILHLGRPWFAYWLAAYPDKMNVWPQWRSSLVWDFTAIAVYLSVSILFWYLGLIPDLATLRDRARSRRGQVFYGLLALGSSIRGPVLVAFGYVTCLAAGRRPHQRPLSALAPIGDKHWLVAFSRIDDRRAPAVDRTGAPTNPRARPWKHARTDEGRRAGG